MMEMKGNAILVWAWADAPDEYKQYSPHGGDEDWVAFIPEGTDTYIPWMHVGTPFGISGVSEHVVRGGIIRIGAHA